MNALHRWPGATGPQAQNQRGAMVPYDVLPPDRAPDLRLALTKLVVQARDATGAQYAAINILDRDCQIPLAATAGVSPAVVDRAASICGRLMAGPRGMSTVAVGDASKDRDLWDSPMVSGGPGGIRFYAGAPLIGRDGEALGMLCVWSTKAVSDATAHAAALLLQPLRDTVLTMLEARRSALKGPVDARPVIPRVRTSVEVEDGPEIDAIIDEGRVRTLFQPVVHLESGAVVGFEALSRGPAGSAWESPLALIDAARQAGRLGELDWLCRVSAMKAAAEARLHPSLSWLINVEPSGLAIECPSRLLPGLSRARGQLRVILEVVERDVHSYAYELIDATDQARRDAWGVALDDVGAEESSLALLPLLRPDVVKLDMTLVRQNPKAEAASITAAVRAYAELTGAVILAEGIETEEHEQLARVFGATYGQGYRYGRPGPLPSAVPAPLQAIPLRQRLEPLDGQTPFEVLSSKYPSARACKEHLKHISYHLEAQTTAAGAASVLLAGFQEREYFSAAARRRYDELSTSNTLTVVLAEGLDIFQMPRYHVGPLSAGSRLKGEWIVIVLRPHFAAAFVARDCGDTGPDGSRRFDYIYTHDRDAVVSAARSYIQELSPPQ